MATFIPAKNDWASGFQEFGQGLSSGYMNRSDENAVREAVLGLGPNASARDILDTLTDTKTYGTQAKQNALENYVGVEKFEELKRHAKKQEEIGEARNAITQGKEAERIANAQKRNDLLQSREDRAERKESREEKKESNERKAAEDLINQIPDTYLSPEQKQVLGKNATLSEATGLFKESIKPEKESEFNKKYYSKLADEYIANEQKIPALKDQITNIDEARKVSNEIGAVGQALSAAGLSQKGKLLESLSFPLIEPILHLLAPRGVIAREKLKIAVEKYGIKGSDFQWQRKAKLDALEHFAKQALARAEERQELIKRHNFRPPMEALDQFDRETQTIDQAMTDYDLVGEPVDLPIDAKSQKGKTIKSPDGQRYYSDGTRWLRK